MARGHLLFSGFDKRALGNHCDRCLSKLFTGRDVGSGQANDTFCSVSFPSGAVAEDKSGLAPVRGQRVSHVDALGHQAPAFPAHQGGGGVETGRRGLGVRWLGRAWNLHPAGSRRQSWGPGRVWTHPSGGLREGTQNVRRDCVVVGIFLFGVLTQGTVTQKRSERGGSQGPWLQAALCPPLSTPDLEEISEYRPDAPHGSSQMGRELGAAEPEPRSAQG